MLFRSAATAPIPSTFGTDGPNGNELDGRGRDGGLGSGHAGPRWTGPVRQRAQGASSGGSWLGPTWRSSQAHTGAAAAHVSVIRLAAAFVCIQAAGSHERPMISPLRRSSTMRAWSLA